MPKSSGGKQPAKKTPKKGAKKAMPKKKSGGYGG